MTTSTNTTYSGPPESSSSTDFQSLCALNRPLLDTLMIAHTSLILIVPLAMSLCYFSTSQSRRRPIFILNLAAIFFAFLVCILIDTYTIHTLLNPLNPWRPVINIVVGLLGTWQSILIDSILLVRLVSVYPRRHIGRIRFALLVATPVILKLTRAINVIVFVKIMVDTMNGPDARTAIPIVFSHSPCVKIDWATQMLDNTYASIVFLWKLQGQGYMDNITSFGNVTLAQHLRILSRIALTNFVVPSIFSIVQFVCLYRGTSDAVLNDLMLVNMMISTFGVAFATVWAGNRSRQEAAQISVSDSDPKHRRVTTSNVMPVFRPDADPEYVTTTRTISSSTVATELQEKHSEVQV